VSQPAHVPVQASDRVRPSALLPPPPQWFLSRPADELDLEQPKGPRFGSPGPDLGYGLKLARRLQPKLVLTEGEHEEDVVAGCFACGARRASHFGRAPVIYDMQWAYIIWGYLGVQAGDVPKDLIAWRKPMFRGAAEHYWDQREIVDAVRVETLNMTPAQALEKLGSWRELFIV
jgi:hypothetical protein